MYVCARARTRKDSCTRGGYTRDLLAVWISREYASGTCRVRLCLLLVYRRATCLRLCARIRVVSFVYVDRSCGRRRCWRTRLSHDSMMMARVLHGVKEKGKRYTVAARRKHARSEMNPEHVVVVVRSLVCTDECTYVPHVYARRQPRTFRQYVLRPLAEMRQRRVRLRRENLGLPFGYRSVCVRRSRLARTRFYCLYSRDTCYE